MKNTTKALLLSLCLSGGSVIVPALARAGIAIDIDVAPPPPRVEVVPAPRVGYVWAPGYWEYRGHEHVWVAGRYVHERRGYHWVPDRWEQHGPHWRRVEGHWER